MVPFTLEHALPFKHLIDETDTNILRMGSFIGYCVTELETAFPGHIFLAI